MDKAQIYETLNQAYFSSDPHERQVIDHLPLLVSGSALCVDCGASLGQYSRAMSRTLHGGRIVAVEADPVRFEELERNAARWSAESDNVVEARHFALTERPGDAIYYVTNSDISGGLTPHDVGREVEWEELRVPGTSLDSLLDGDIPDFVKIDVEGAEMSVLRGATGILEAGRTTFLIELHDFGDDASMTETERLLQGYGYRRVDFFGQDVFVTDRELWRRLFALEMTDVGRARRRIKRTFRRPAKALMARVSRR